MWHYWQSFEDSCGDIIIVVAMGSRIATIATAVGITAAAPLGGIGCFVVGGIDCFVEDRAVKIDHCWVLHNEVQQLHIVDLAFTNKELHIIETRNFKDSYWALIHTVEHTNTVVSYLGSYTHLAAASSC